MVKMPEIPERVTPTTVFLPEVTSAGTEQDLLLTGERRRPGRIQRVKPALIPLLRADEIAKIATDDDGATNNDDQDPLRAARGMAVGLLLVAPFWIGVGGLLWWLW